MAFYAQILRESFRDKWEVPLSEIIEIITLWSPAHDLFQADSGTREVSLHPAHLTDSRDRLLPAALIPFCSYQASMLGKEVDGFVACDQFQPTVLEGQMCYSLDLSKTGMNESSKAGKNNGLELVLDPNIPGDGGQSAARIFLHTLFPFTDYRNGSYAMSSLKKMTATKGFLGMSETNKKCQVENFEDCKTMKYLEKIQKECHCIQWALHDKKKVRESL